MVLWQIGIQVIATLASGPMFIMIHVFDQGLLNHGSCLWDMLQKASLFLVQLLDYHDFGLPSLLVGVLMM
ncbi:hypothetical protein RIF29_11048 [Crotalaria pallida]|uniref:Uncharacterized protein n=1 Tax=Crotalaria pallida TaxID=3830 RepID=A0AAN9ILT8_CROPI